MFQLCRITQMIPFMFFVMAVSPVFGQDKPVPKTTASTRANSGAEAEAKKDAPVRFIMYFSMTFTDLQTAQDRIESSDRGVKRARAKLNGSGGMRAIENGNDLKDLAKHLPGGEKEAKLLFPVIEQGWHVLIIMDPEETEWSKPMVISPYLDVYDQIEFAREQDKKACPKRYLVAPSSAGRSTASNK